MSDKQNPFDNAFQLRRAIVAISERQGSQLRSTLDQFIRHVAPGMVNSHSDFPITVRRHNLDRERADRWLTRDEMLCFHVGNAVLAYYDTCRFPPCTHVMTAVFDARLALLESIAVLGLDEFVVVGTDSVGYTLKEKGEVRAELANKAAEEKTRWGREDQTPPPTPKVVKK
jgi:hypothetical protein